MYDNAIQTSASYVPDALRVHHATLHFTPAVRHGDQLYCSGILGLGADGMPISDPEIQFIQIFAAIQNLLSMAGASLVDILEATSYHVDMQQHWQTFRQVKEQYIAAPFSAWTAIGTSELALPGALAEVRVLARIPNKSRLPFAAPEGRKFFPALESQPLSPAQAGTE